MPCALKVVLGSVTSAHAPQSSPSFCAPPMPIQPFLRESVKRVRFFWSNARGRNQRVHQPPQKIEIPRQSERYRAIVVIEDAGEVCVEIGGGDIFPPIGNARASG